MEAALDRRWRPSARRSLIQIATSVVPYLFLWGAMIWSLQVSYWLTLGLAVLAAGFMLRTFIIFHDCGHGSFFRSKRANHLTEYLTGLLTFTPWRQWRRQHAQHHATSGDLDRRGFGDVWMMTAREYLEASKGERIAYAISRNPFVLFIVAPLYVFLIRQRFPARDVGPREHRGVHLTNAGLAVLITVMCLTIGIKAYLLIQLPVMFLAGVAGIWLFYVQHQFEGVYWSRHEGWDYSRGALEGSSFYKLPRVLQWFSGNIGFHHVHHLNAGIPNYKLPECHRSSPLFQGAPTLTLRSSLRSLGLRLWDEEGQRMIGYKALRNLQAAGPGARAA